ncbi:phosphodiester glycosidase family protein [Aminiphilus sp.]|uniref:phosphodiester glycosidase family protein n=1 Tax=Aminiphilus sp. TaxID=1872488 RepID=UPI0026169151|nr:phosphodiester glycosidase family protein [Aminiphilus sp.]
MRTVHRFGTSGEKCAGEKTRELRGVLTALLVVLLLLQGALAEAESGGVRRDAFVQGILEARGLLAPGEAKSPAQAVAFARNIDAVPYSDQPPGGAVTRKEALRMLVHSLGLRFEAGLLAEAPLPYEDLKGLSPSDRGAVAAARLMVPPLLEGNAKRLSPDQKISPAEAKHFLEVLALAGQGFVLRAELAPAKGMRLLLHREGAPARSPRWRAIIDGFDGKNEAEQLRKTLAGAGPEMKVENHDYEWRLRSDMLDSFLDAERLRKAGAKAGKEARILPCLPSYENLSSPRFWVALIIDPGLFGIRPLLPPEGLSTLAPLAAMTGGNAVAAINGGFFTTTGYGRGSPIGTLLVDGTLVSEPMRGRTCLGWNRDNLATFGPTNFSGRVFADAFGERKLATLNRFTKGDALVLFTPHFGRRTPSSGSVPAAEAVLRDGRCLEVRQGSGGDIPAGARVLAGYGAQAPTVAALRPGDAVRVEMTLNEGDPLWGKMDHIVQGGPFLIFGGEIQNDPENLSDSVTLRRHPRSVIGLTGNGQWVFFVGDGRNPFHSVGFTLREVSEILRELHVDYALNLDGGGSSELLVKGKRVSLLSEGKPRPVSYGIGAAPFRP